ncbi:GNAT family N-acetyltransferase [Bacillus sp. FJAT-27445]|uniref:GNAT family N-acetyltransferase n=1 Tax=Bacillus sp. FJAT-27445 TaxID=1679166 RepID=UPI000AA51CA9|nr:GNAT family N-acetyltransferase [Bacillus sp. FJAT-27445]
MIIIVKTSLTLSVLTESDIEGLMALSTSVGWDYDTNEITTILSSGQVFGHKNEKGEIVSSAAIIPYDNKLASVGMVIVHHDYRGKGLGKETTQACIDFVSGQTAVMLIATPNGKPMYEKMGFNEVGSIHKLVCKKYIPFNGNLSEKLTIEAMQENDFEKVIELDKLAFGDSRRKFLLNRIKQAHQSLIMRDQFGSVCGFGLSILGQVNMIVGPIVAPDFKAAADLTNQLAFHHNGRLRIDIPIDDQLFMDFLEERGFKRASQPPIMILKSQSLPHRNNNLYAIAAQIFG